MNWDHPLRLSFLISLSCSLLLVSMVLDLNFCQLDLLLISICLSVTLFHLVCSQFWRSFWSRLFILFHHRRQNYDFRRFLCKDVWSSIWNLQVGELKESISLHFEVQKAKTQEVLIALAWRIYCLRISLKFWWMLFHSFHCLASPAWILWAKTRTYAVRKSLTC